jgi:lactoylglutathione lyase
MPEASEAGAGGWGGGGSAIRFNHIGLAVTDLDRARRFYEGALGFQYWWELQAPEEGTAKLLQLQPPVGLHAVYLVRDEFVLELLEYRDRQQPPWRRRAMDEPGLTHLSLAVEDLPAALERVGRTGGTVMADTHMGAAVMVRDPDGQLIELTSWDWRSALPPPPGAAPATSNT